MGIHPSLYASKSESTLHHVKHVTSFAALNDGVYRDILKAALLAEPFLGACDNLDSARRDRSRW